VDGREPRYRFPAGFGKSPVLFNYHRAAASVGDRVIVVEGFFDCLRMRQAGWESVVALLGTELYEHPAELLRARFSGCCCCWMETRRGVWLGTESRPD